MTKKKSTLLKEKELRKVKREKKRNEKERYGEWRNSIYLRDNFTCIVCNKYLKDGNTKNMQAHHLLAKETWPELKYDIMNGITLCYFCHKNSKYSPHLNAVTFVELLKIKRPEQYNYLIDYLNRETQIKLN